MRVLLLSPHLDDAVLSCWHLLDSPRDVLVVNVFTGLPPEGTELPRWDRVTGARDARARVEERLAEDRAALALAGRESVGLGYVERQYGAASPSVEELVAALARLEGDEVVAPAGIGHSAHALVRDAALALGRRCSFYADVPYATEFGWPAWVRRAQADPYLDVDAEWEPAVRPLVAAGYAARSVALSESQQRRKAKALRAYRTQFAALEVGAQRRLTHPEVLAWEVVWERP